MPGTLFIYFVIFLTVHIHYSSSGCSPAGYSFFLSWVNDSCIWENNFLPAGPRVGCRAGFEPRAAVQQPSTLTFIGELYPKFYLYHTIKRHKGKKSRSKTVLISFVLVEQSKTFAPSACLLFLTQYRKTKIESSLYLGSDYISLYFIYRLFIFFVGLYFTLFYLSSIRLSRWLIVYGSLKALKEICN